MRLPDQTQPIIMGVINVTPDSFSDGGRFFAPDAAVEHAKHLLATGADVLDLGAESTRPGAQPVPADEEIRRLLPVISALVRDVPDIRISVDTTKAMVARAALDAGATLINDVSALRLDSEMGSVCAEYGATVILMHSRGTVADMASYDHAQYGGGAAQGVIVELREAIERAEAAGIRRDRIVIDPGVGFSKRSEDSVAVLRELPAFVALGFPVLVGASRKRVIGELINEPVPEARDAGSIGAHVAAFALGARIFRVHNVLAHRQALDVAHTILSAHTSGTVSREVRA